MTTTDTRPLDHPRYRHVKATAAEYADGLRRLADMIEASPDIPITYLDNPNVWFGRDADTVAAIIRAGKAAGAEIVKYGTEDSMQRNVGVRFGAVEAMALVDKAAVCERVVTGTRTIRVPDPAYIPPSVPRIEQTVDDVEWKCRPLLAGGAS